MLSYTHFTVHSSKLHKQLHNCTISTVRQLLKWYLLSAAVARLEGDIKHQAGEATLSA